MDEKIVTEQENEGQETEVVTYECNGRELHLHLHNVLVGDNSSFCLCCPCCGSDGNGNGDGDGNGDGNDDDQPGNVKVSLLGGTGAETFMDLAKIEGGYAVVGKTDKSVNLYSLPTMLLATYDSSLTLTSQTHYPQAVVDVQRKPLIQQMLTGNRLALLGAETSASNSSWRDMVLFDVDMETKASLGNQVRYSGGVMGPQSLVLAPADYTGSAALVVACEDGALYAFDKDINLIKSVKVQSSGKNCSFRNGLMTQNQGIFVGKATGNFDNSFTSGILVVLDDLLNAEAIVAYGYESSVSFLGVRLTDSGILLAGNIYNKVNSKNDVLVLEVDQSYRPVKRAILSAGTGDHTLGSLDIDKAGNLLLCGLTSSIGAGGHDVFLVRMDKDFNITKEMTFGSVAQESTPCALFDEDGSVTFAGTTNGAGGGNTDGFIARVSGNWEELTGGLKKYPHLSINGKPGFTVNRDFALQLNNSTTYALTTAQGTKKDITITANTNPGFVVDPNAVVEV